MALQIMNVVQLESRKRGHPRQRVRSLWLDQVNEMGEHTGIDSQTYQVCEVAAALNGEDGSLLFDPESGSQTLGQVV